MRRCEYIALLLLALAVSRADVEIPGGIIPIVPPGETSVPLPGGLPDAPATGGPYGRQSNAWVEVSGGTGGVSGVNAVINTTNLAGVASIAGSTIYIGTQQVAGTTGELTHIVDGGTVGATGSVSVVGGVATITFPAPWSSTNGMTLAAFRACSTTNAWVTLTVNGGLVQQSSTNWTGAIVVGNPYAGMWHKVNIIEGVVKNEL
jgi:hypothetical protein